MSSESNEDYLNQVKQEIRAQAQALSQRPLLARHAPPAHMPGPAADAIERDRLDYPIGELTDPHHLAFIERAFRALLKRTPDTTESEAQLRLLATGMSKAELLGNLRWSPEGRRLGVRVGGLLPRYVSAKLRRVPVLGYALDWGLSLAALPMLARHQRASDALFAAGDACAAAAWRALSARADALDAGTTTALRAAQAQQMALQQACDALRGRIEALENTAAAHAGRLDELGFLRQRVYAINHWSHYLTEAFARIETVAAQRQTELGHFCAEAALRVVATDAARGARNRAWADTFVAQLPPGGAVLTLAGDGDWPALLVARGWQASAAEPHTVLAEAARAQGVIVEPVAAREALRRAADASLDGLSVLALPALARTLPILDLLSEARRVLRGDGALLLACAREAVALADALLEAGAPTPDMDTLAQTLALAGFVEIARLDSADGTPALLARRARA